MRSARIGIFAPLGTSEPWPLMPSKNGKKKSLNKQKKKKVEDNFLRPRHLSIPACL